MSGDAIVGFVHLRQEFRNIDGLIESGGYGPTAMMHQFGLWLDQARHTPHGVVFDIGNVLIHWEPRALYRKIFASEDEVTWFLDNVCTHDWNLEQDRGRSFAEAVREATARFPEHADAIAAYDLRWHETMPGS